MKLGYLFVPPEHHRSERFGAQDCGRSSVARALGFSEFYVPVAGSETRRSGPRGPEGEACLELRSTAICPPGLRLASTRGVTQSTGETDHGLFVSPQIQAAQTIAAGPCRAPFSVSWADTETLSRHWSAHVTGCTRAGRCAHPGDWRVARSVLIADDVATARDMVMAPASPCRSYFRNILGPHARKARIDEAIDACVLYGDPGAVADKLLRITRATAVFGTLVLADHPWADVARALRSMILLEDVIQQCFGYSDRQMVSGWQ
ncbi:hypothetical protein Q4543_06615 [Salipiger sp. 1_MG-2023]|uniref:hypothetical protein n=1 Tax=Salipiger sp. 1_MG-2023 TaxID=3062665 RepID=UPI0026E2B945|nr:hypothetical protein [Salipiger sp. 1_MG-2023]MDO6585185.1 hypothetical protein [Salipiger sp. 1_MG-2023]